MKQRILSFILVLGMMISNIVVFAERNIQVEGVCGNNLIWSLDDTGKLVINGKGEMKDFNFNEKAPWQDWMKHGVITEVMIDEGITSIGNCAFEGQMCLSTVVLPSTLIKIGDNAFSGCSLLKSIALPQNLIYIGEAAFNATGLNNIVIPDGVTEIKTSTFASCEELATVVLPNKVKRIDANGFLSCKSLTDINVPNSIEYIGDQAFFGCEKLKSKFDLTNIHEIGVAAFWNCYELSVRCTYRNNWKEEGLVYCKLYCVMPKGLTRIPDEEFVSSNLVGIELPNGISYIGKGAFSGCQYLEEITIPKTVTEIGEGAFSGCYNIKKIVLQDRVDAIGRYAFSGCHQAEVYISSKFENVSLFDDCKSVHYNVSDGMSEVDAWSFNRNAVNITIPDSVETMDENVFLYCRKIENLSIPFVGASRTAGGAPDGMFGYLFGNFDDGEYVVAKQSYATNQYATYLIPTSLKKVYITDANQIPYGAFSGCSGLEYIEINEGVSKIGQKAFANCGFLSVKIPKSVTQIGTDAFSGTDVEKLYVYENSYAHNYAKENNFKYELIGSSKTNINETENDNIIDKDSEEVKQEIDVKSITLNYDNVELTKGETITLKQMISPSNATNKKVIWTSSKSSVATVKNGKVTAVSEGTAIITATTEDGNKNANCVVVVSDNIKKNDANNQIILKIGSKTAKVFGMNKTNDVAPKLVNNRTMLPARFVTENLGATVTWEESAPDMVVITKDNVTIIIYIGSDLAYVNGERLVLDSPAFIENDRTYTPIRFISEALGANVEWNGDTQEVIITL